MKHFQGKKIPPVSTAVHGSASKPLKGIFPGTGLVISAHHKRRALTTLERVNFAKIEVALKDPNNHIRNRKGQLAYLKALRESLQSGKRAK